MSEGLQSFLPSAFALTVMAGVALCVTVARGGIRADAITLRKASGIAILTVIVQAGHFIEEAATGLDRRLPEIFGLGPLSTEAFVTFNLVWLVIWVISAWALTRRSGSALFPLWFLGIACVANAVIHPALSLVTGGYFSGLVTSPLVGLAGLLLLRRLSQITQPSQSGHIDS